MRQTAEVEAEAYRESDRPDLQPGFPHKGDFT